MNTAPIHILARLRPHEGGQHTDVRVFAGKQREHRACCGVLVMHRDEAQELATSLANRGHDVELESP